MILRFCHFGKSHKYTHRNTEFKHERAIVTTDYKQNFQTFTENIPLKLRNEDNIALMDNLFNRFMTHDESIPLYGYVGAKPTQADDLTPRVPETSVERDINGVIPVLTFQQGTETVAYTIQDLIRKARAIGISDTTLHYLYSQGNNFAPPIDMDKFTNFFNYYWVAGSLPVKPVLSWNPTLAPEYYVIAAPGNSDLVKRNVRLATTNPIIMTGSGFRKTGFTVEFITDVDFRITADDLSGFTPIQDTFTLTGNSTPVDFVVTNGARGVSLIKFDITLESITTSEGETVTAAFTAGDKFIIACDFLTRNYTVGFNGSAGLKGKVEKFQSLNTYQEIDGVRITLDDRILVKDAAPDVAGIYIVKQGEMVRAADFTGDLIVPGVTVYVLEGVVNGRTIFTSIPPINGRSAGVGFQREPRPVGGSDSPNSDWQEGNFWVSGDGLAELGLSRADAIQAVRPIIEYASDLQLNAYVRNGKPDVTGTYVRQYKHIFNQLPFFDLFRYDGTPSHFVSAVFYYEEDLTATLDVKLQKRTLDSTNASADFIFNHGMEDESGGTLFVKRGGALHSVWTPGYNKPTIAGQTFTGLGNGEMSGIEAKGFTQSQVWRAVCASPTTFIVSASKFGAIPQPYDVCTVGVPYSNYDVEFTITEGSTPFSVGDEFIFSVGNLETPQYQYRTEDGDIRDKFTNGHYDYTDSAWKVPRTFYNNPYSLGRSPIVEGTLYSHFRSILANQVGESFNPALGGSIKLWSEQQTLLASLLMQKDLTPISMIDMSQRQYERALNAVQDILTKNITQYLGDNGTVQTYDELNHLLDFILKIRSSDNDVKTVLFDTTSPVVGFPATLPQLGIAGLVEPVIALQGNLGRETLTHHDGHQSLLVADDLDLRLSIFGDVQTLMVKRSDGEETPALTVSVTMPARPYRGQLWQDGNGTIRAFQVDRDTTTAPSAPNDGMTWYNRSSGVVYRFDGVGHMWIAETGTAQFWVGVDLANILNSIMLLVETRLYRGINPHARKFDFSAISDPAFDRELKRELFQYASMRGYDPLGSDYDPQDAFTWNYSSTGMGARWFDVLEASQRAVSGVIPTSTPNMEPWKLFGFESGATWFAGLSAFDQARYTPMVSVDEINASFINGGGIAVVKTDNSSTQLFGLGVVDGYQLRAGDKVLLTNEPDITITGLWLASSGAWTRIPNPENKTLVEAVEGQHKGAVFALVGDAWGQVRRWTDALWVDAQALHPTLKLSVNTFIDTLLPPYVNVNAVQSQNALMNTRPASAREAYNFNENSPVQVIWEQSMDYRYSQAKALFRYDPLAFLGFCWGFNWVEVDGILYDGLRVNMPQHKQFLLHGDPLPGVERPLMSVVGTGKVTAVYTAYTVSDSIPTVRGQSFTIYQDGEVLGYASEGDTVAVAGVSFTLEDSGIPFRIGDRYEVANGTSLFVPVTSMRFMGFGQTFTNALREISISGNSTYAVSAYRGWDVSMGYRAGGMVSTDDLSVYTDTESLSSASYDLHFKKNEIATDEWLQALRISVVKFGLAEDQPDGVKTPLDAGADWTFRIEGYNPRYNGITINTLSPDDSITFNALDKAHTALDWLQRINVTGELAEELPVTITGIQEVVNFLYGYESYLLSRGWKFDSMGEFNIDAQTGRVRTFQLEVEKFIDALYTGVKLGEGQIINSFMQRAYFNQAKGLLAPFTDASLFDISGHPGVFDTLGVKFSKADISVIRSNESSAFSAAAPMFSAHIQTEEFEHLFIMKDFARPSEKAGLLYDPFTGARVVTYRFNGRKQATQTMRGNFGGHYQYGGKVRQNLQASTDNIAYFYDANRAFENETTTRHALHLLGYTSKNYFESLDVSQKTQFNFWRGLIQAKGTNMSIDAYLNNARYQEAKVDEYWAYKVAQYGDARQRAYPEMKLEITDALTQFTKFQFDSTSLAEEGFETINHFDENRWFSLEDMSDSDVHFTAELVGEFIIESAVQNQVYALPFVADLLKGENYSPVNGNTVTARYDGRMVVQGYGPAKPRFNPVKIFNYRDDEMVAEVPIWHPAAGQHTPLALEGVNIIGSVNPAKFNNTTRLIGNPTYDPLRPWGEREVGRVWLNTTNLDYLPYWDKSVFETVDERLSRWGRLTDYASVDVWEWVQSTVPPDQYDALALAQAGDASLAPEEKASGKAAGAETYQRDRVWKIRPVAWSYSEVARDIEWGANPPFPGGSTDAGLTLRAGWAVLEKGTFTGFNVLPGMHLGAWNNDPVTPMPLSEYRILDNRSKEFNDVSGVPFSPQPTPLFSVSIEAAPEYASTSGQLLFSGDRVEARNTFDGTWEVSSFVRVSNDDMWEDAKVIEAIGVGSDPVTHYGAEVQLTSGVVYRVEFPRMGITVTVTSLVDQIVGVGEMAHQITMQLNSRVVMCDAIQISNILASNDTDLSNDPVGTSMQAGWRAWRVPTQADLAGDGFAPLASWKPYRGEFQTISASYDEIQTAIETAPLTLRGGETVDRFSTSWTDYQLLSDRNLTWPQVQPGYQVVRNGTSVEFTQTENFPVIQTSVYVNGILQLKAQYTLVGKTLTVLGVGDSDSVVIRVRKYEPTKDELDFNPEEKDDLSIQRQYRIAYQFCKQDVRDSSGSIRGSLYWFWVSDRPVAAVGKRQSIQSMALDIVRGPEHYLTFQGLNGGQVLGRLANVLGGPQLNPTPTPQYYYNAITLSGLNYVVLKDETFKLRFTRDFTLRDDPEELNLKNVHTEWALMRPGQRQPVPAGLWDKLTDSAAGVDIAGNVIPSLRRVLYDERNNTQSQFGFGPEQTLAPKELLRESIVWAILNTRLMNESSEIPTVDYLEVLDLDTLEDQFSTPQGVREAMGVIYNSAKVSQVNEIFFAALEDVLASNYELSDIFKTSRISAYSIKVINTTPKAPTYE